MHGLLNWETLQQLVRILLQVAAGGLVSAGVINEEMGATVIGAGLSLAGVLWWALWERYRQVGDSPAGSPEIV